uniref:Uncharacterized protein n=1 Tax=Sipha flava TaxID=143950 RepID=A0A2S2R814_9HEMI
MLFGLFCELLRLRRSLGQALLALATDLSTESDIFIFSLCVYYAILFLSFLYIYFIFLFRQTIYFFNYYSVEFFIYHIILHIFIYNTAFVYLLTTTLLIIICGEWCTPTIHAHPYST